MLIDNSGRPLVPTAKISVGNLQQNDRDDCGDVEFSLDDDGNGLVSLRGHGLESEIIVKGRVRLQFQFRERHVPIGIGFSAEPQDGGGRDDKARDRAPAPDDQLGLDAFPERKIVSANGTTLLIVHDDHPAEACFKFSLVIQKRDGRLIILDPKIRNVPM